MCGVGFSEEMHLRGGLTINQYTIECRLIPQDVSEKQTDLTIIQGHMFIA